MRKSLILLTGILIGCLPGLLFAGINPNNVGLVTVNVDLVNPSNDCNFYSQGLGTAVDLTRTDILPGRGHPGSKGRNRSSRVGWNPQ